MAGGKETPRQKMISLMYLVLLAMLALQVSSVIIEKFQQLNTSLEASIGAAHIRNSEIMEQIKQAVEKNKNAKQDVAKMDAALAIRKKSKALLDQLSVIKEELVSKTGGLDDNGNYRGAKEEEPVSNYMLGIGESKSGQGYKLQRALKEYEVSLERLAKEQGLKLPKVSLAMDGKEDPIFKNNPEQRNKDFAHLNFEGTPLVAALAVLSEKANTITSLESEVLTKLANQVGTNIIPVDRVRPVVKTTSKMVVAGTEYEADFFMAAYSSNFKPKMTYNGEELDANNEGVGQVRFKASGGAYNADGIMKKIWKGSITYPKADGTDSIYTIEQEYFVVKPAIQVQSASVQALYKDCGNKLTFNVPALGADYDPKFTATGARIKTTNKRGEIIIIPSSPNVTIKVNNKGTYIGNTSFKVKLIPKPTLRLTCKNKEVDPVKGVSNGDLRSVKIEAIADRDMKRLNPDDTHYKVKKWKAILVRNGRIKGNPVIINGQRGVLTTFSSDARSGDRIIIDEVKVKRRNFEGNILPVDIGNPVFIIPIK